MKKVLLTMTMNGEPFRRQLPLKAAFSKVASLAGRQQVSNVIIVGRTAEEGHTAPFQRRI